MKIFRRKNRTSDIKRYVYWIMNKYFSNLKWALPALGVLPSLGAFAADDAATEKKNVLFIIVDDLRTELNCYGAKYMKTPHIDRLAAQGVMFENAYCNVPVSGASRASLFSGLRPAKQQILGCTGCD